MSLRTVSRRHLGLISLHWTRYAVRGGAGLTFLIIALLFGLGVAQGILTPVEMLMAQEKRQGRETSREEIVAIIVDSGRPVARWALGGGSGDDEAAAATTGPGQPSPPGPMMEQPAPDAPASAGPPADPPADPWTTFLLDDRPALLSAVFLILVFGMPLLIPFLAFNQISGDVQSRGLRYVLLRTERAGIFFGRFLGTAIFSTLVMAFIVATITFYVGVKINIYSAGPLAAWGLHGFLALAILMLPYIAVCSWISASVDSPFFSLVLANLVIGGVVLFAFLASLQWKPAAYLKYALPWGVQNHLFHPELTHSLGAALACLGYTVVFLLLGYHRFETRDL